MMVLTGVEYRKILLKLMGVTHSFASAPLVTYKHVSTHETLNQFYNMNELYNAYQVRKV
jgi:hypothetical protein